MLKSVLSVEAEACCLTGDLCYLTGKGCCLTGKLTLKTRISAVVLALSLLFDQRLVLFDRQKLRQPLDFKEEFGVRLFTL